MRRSAQLPTELRPPFPRLAVVAGKQVKPLLSRERDNPALFGRRKLAPEPEELQLLRELDELADIWLVVRQKVGRADAKGWGDPPHPFIGKAPLATLKAS